MPDPIGSAMMASMGSAAEVEIRHTAEGWSFAYGARRAGPFGYLDQVDDVEVAAELNGFGPAEVEEWMASPGKTAKPWEILPKDILRLRLMAMNGIYAPKGVPEARGDPEPLVVESSCPRRRFVATSSPGPEVPASGFILFEGREWIAAETTYLYGILEEEGEGKEGATRAERFEAILFFNISGRRGASFLRGSAFEVGGRALRPSSRTLGTSGPPTLMGMEAGNRFLRGDAIGIEGLYEAASAGLRRFANLSWDPRLYDVVVCAVMASYFFDLFGAFPIVMIIGPFESGKTRLLLSMVYMGHRGMPILDPTEASIFRTAEAWKGFLGIDEFWRVGAEIERLLRASYKRGMKVPRVEKAEGGRMYLGLFDIFGKVAIASQEPFPPNIASKGITLQLRRMPDPNPERRDPEPRDFEEVRAKGYIARLTLAPLVKAYADRLDGRDLGLSGRDYEVWKPVLTIASMMGGQAWENVLSYARESAERKREESYEELKEVLDAIYGLIKDAGGRFPVTFTPKQIHDAIWERLKDQYRVTKERQEVEGEAMERYDYDTHRFERVYSVHKIGRTYLRQLGLSGKRTRRGTQHEIPSALAFHELVVRYHPELPGQEVDYSSLVPTSKLMQLLPPGPDSHLGKAAPGGGISKAGGINNATPEGNAIPESPGIASERGPGGISCISGAVPGASPPSRDGSPPPGGGPSEGARPLIRPAPPMGVDGDADRALEAVLGALRGIEGPFSLDYALEKAAEALGDRGEARAWLERLERDGLLARDPDGFYGLRAPDLPPKAGACSLCHRPVAEGLGGATYLCGRPVHAECLRGLGEDPALQREACLLALRRLEGPFDRDGALEELAEALGDRGRAEAWWGRLAREGLLAEMPGGLWALTR
jgi:hypothetical protein